MKISPVVDVSGMQVVDSDHAMSACLFALGWSSTEKFQSYNIYYSRDRATRQLRIIGATRYLPTSADCVHYVLVMQ